MFLILLAGLQSLPQEPFEAARVDGAGAWRIFVDLTLPMLRPVLAIAIVLGRSTLSAPSTRSSCSRAAARAKRPS